MKISDQELLAKALSTAKTEQAAALQLLEYLVEIDLRRLYTVKSYSTLFEYLVKELRFSEMQAYERVNAVRLIRAVPVAKEKIEQGNLTITTASQVQRFFNQEKKHGDHPISIANKIEVIESASGKSKREVEKVLLSLQSDGAKVIAKEKMKPISETLTELKFQIKEETVQKLNEVKDLLGNESLAIIFDAGLNELLLKLKKKQGRVEESRPKVIVKAEVNKVETKFAPSEKPTFPGKLRLRYISIHAKRTVFARSQGQCEFTSSDGKRCQSKHRLHIDHRHAFAKGGSNEANNLRHLCAQHNQRAALDAGLIQPKLM